MPSLLRRFKTSTEPTTCEEDENKPPVCQASLPWSAPSDGDRRQSEASLSRRFSRQLSLSSLPFKRKKSIVPTQYHDQSQCLFLDRLPFEIRENVYIAMMKPEDWIVVLPKMSDDPRQLKKQQKRRVKEARVPRSEDFHAFLNMMRSCKAIHEETQSLLFEKLVLRCPSLTTFTHFISTTASSHWTELRHLSLNVSLPYILFHEREGGPREDKQEPSKMQYYSRDAWINTCDFISKMHKLKSLTVSMYARDYRDLHPHWPSRPSKRLWDALAEPLLRIKCADFVVEVSWPLNEDTNECSKPFLLRGKAFDQTHLEQHDTEGDDASSDDDNAFVDNSDD